MFINTSQISMHTVWQRNRCMANANIDWGLAAAVGGLVWSLCPRLHRRRCQCQQQHVHTGYEGRSAGLLGGNRQFLFTTQISHYQRSFWCFFAKYWFAIPDQCGILDICVLVLRFLWIPACLPGESKLLSCHSCVCVCECVCLYVCVSRLTKTIGCCLPYVAGTQFIWRL